MSKNLDDILKAQLAQIEAQCEKDRDLWVPLVIFGFMASEAKTDIGVLMNALMDASGTAHDQELIARTKAAIAA